MSSCTSTSAIEQDSKTSVLDQAGGDGETVHPGTSLSQSQDDAGSIGFQSNSPDQARLQARMSIRFI